MTIKNLHSAGKILDALKSLKKLRSDAELAAFLGIKAGTLSSWRSRDTLDWPLILANCSPEEIRDVFYAEREALESMQNALVPENASSPSAAANGREAVYIRPRPDDELVFVDFYPNVKVSAGGGLIGEDPTEPPHQMAFRTYFVKRKLNSNAKELVALTIHGRSMEPYISDGDVVLVDRSRTKPVSESLYIISIEEEVYCKMLQVLPGGVIRVKSFNPTFEPFEVQRDQLNIIGQVRWHGHTWG